MTKTKVILSPRKEDSANILTVKMARKIVRDRNVKENAPTNVSASPAIQNYDPPLGPKRKRKKDR
jgi:hypothetical protein